MVLVIAAYSPFAGGQGLRTTHYCLLEHIRYSGRELGRVSGLYRPVELWARLTGRRVLRLIVMTISVLIMWKPTELGSKNLPRGILFGAKREDEIAARASGINTIAYKILALAVGGLFVAMARGLMPTS